MSDIKHTIRQYSFPHCSREALSIIEQLTINHNTGRTVISKSIELVSEIIEEFVFCETSPLPDGSQNSSANSNRAKKLTCIQELQLLEVLCDYFSYPGGNEAAHNTVFMNLFPDSHKDRSRLLVKLVSISISTRSKPVLNATGIWMQQLGCTSDYSLELAKGLVNDYFVLVPKAIERLQDLPKIAPRFTANFITAVAELYSLKENNENLPPEALLEVVTEWVSKNTNLCTAALFCHEPALPQGGIPMPPVTPFAGLFRWCILAPLASSTTSKLYSKLHLALLESLLDTTIPRENVVCAQHLASIVYPVLHLSQGKTNAALQLALDRLAQAVQVILESNSIYGKKQELFNLLDTLPDNRLLLLVKNKHKGL
ncbi:hypothetical protein RUM44_004746 [Polyplax serrata]|uniref:Uncharacterized protein n=1 Tax=Polyplax serrata TaxID=468196 RepID=A0ABR1B462_POLSC